MELQANILMTLNVRVGQPRIVGQTPEGRLQIIPIIGGTFEGPALRGEVCPGGADWNTVSGSHCHVLARYWLQTDDGEILSITNEGRFEAGDESAVIMTTPSFRSDKQGRYTFLNTGTYAGELRGGDADSVNIVIWKLN